LKRFDVYVFQGTGVGVGEGVGVAVGTGVAVGAVVDVGVGDGLGAGVAEATASALATAAASPGLLAELGVGWVAPQPTTATTARSIRSCARLATVTSGRDSEDVARMVRGARRGVSGIRDSVGRGRTASRRTRSSLA